MTLGAKDICVINASNPINTSIEWDEYVDYREGVSEIFKSPRPTKMFRSWHSLACCLETEFFVYNKPKWEGVYKYKAVILLVNRDLQAVEPLIKKLKLMKKKVAVGFHENGSDLLLQSMDPNWLVQFKKLIDLAGAQWNVVMQWQDMFRGLHNKSIISSGMAIPFDVWSHGITKPVEERKGILIGTRTLNMRIPRNTWYSLILCNRVAQEVDTHITYLNEDHFDMQDYCNKLGLDRIKVVKGPLPSYFDWLELISAHKFVYHYDTAHTLGQVLSDCLLVDVPCYGGNSDNNQYIYTETMSAQKDECWNLVNMYPYTQPATLESMEFFKVEFCFDGVQKHIVKKFNEI